MTAPISNLYTEVRQHANQCPDVTINTAVVKCLREFCRQSWYLQELLPPIDIVANQATYTLVPSTGFDIINVDTMKVSGYPYVAVSLQDIDDMPDNTAYMGYSFEPTNLLTLYPTPTSAMAAALSVRITEMPQETATTIPDTIYNYYKTDLVSGALAYILSMQKESWSNPSLAAAKEVEFRRGIYNAKMRRSRGFISRPASMRPRPFAI